MSIKTMKEIEKRNAEKIAKWEQQKEKEAVA